MATSGVSQLSAATRISVGNLGMVLGVFHSKRFRIHDTHTIGFIKEGQALPENAVFLGKHILQFPCDMAEQLVIIKIS